jgi:hypothetical protein
MMFFLDGQSRTTLLPHLYRVLDERYRVYARRRNASGTLGHCGAVNVGEVNATLHSSCGWHSDHDALT